MPQKRKLKQRTPVNPFPLIAPGFRGLNTELATSFGTGDPFWAVVLQNAVFDDNGRIALRKGWRDQTTTAITGTPDMWVLHEFLRDDGTVTLITKTSGDEIHESTDDGATWSDISGAISTTSDDWVFVNLADKLYATAPGHKIWQYTGTGTFTQITSSNVSNGVLLAAFGRLWAGRDASSVVDFSGLLDGTDWTTTSHGQFDTANAWTQGSDVVKGIAAFGATLLVFGGEQILMYVDGSGSILGVDPTQMYVVDTIEGSGLLHKNSIIKIGEGDVWYISEIGVQSIKRVVQEKTNPTTAVSANIRSLITSLNTAHIGSAGGVRGLYSKNNNFALFIYPESNTVLMFDTKRELEDGAYRAAEWTGLDFFGGLVRRNGDILFGLTAGNIAKYDLYRDDGTAGTPTKFDMIYASPWLDFGADLHNRIKIVKQFYVIIYGHQTLTATARWAFDFRPLEFSETFTNDSEVSGGEFGAGEFGEDEFATGFRLRRQYVSGAGDGQFVKLWITLESTDVDALVAIQECGVYAKAGRNI